MRFDLEAHPMQPFRTVDDGLCHVLKQLEGMAVPISFRSYSPDLRNTYLDMGVTVLLERPKAWSDPPDFVGTDDGSSCDPARLAAGLRVLALVLWTLLAQAGRRASEEAVALRAVEAIGAVWLPLQGGPAVFDSS